MMEATPRPSVAAVFDGMATWVVQSDRANYFGATKAEAEANARSHADLGTLRASHAALVAALDEANRYAMAVNMALVKGNPTPLLYGDTQWGDGEELGRWQATLDAARNLEGER
jgi:hypothetical protein